MQRFLLWWVLMNEKAAESSFIYLLGEKKQQGS